ncbi:hypothetical protein GO730_38560 [Spirosoma sp. HMF3257]|uniref:Toprim domain-containing protein n=1 Tax=Spirosoma telluris TaxID=2183553 RepID=A0A327NGC9_9BACT|nr:hypothetical protein [Spirosoma telluris]RAI73006.1 hypothetical protein HMF3257_38475 [Spirosoma telluris]
MRTATFKSHATGSDRGHGVWISNQNETPTRRLVVGESAIDLLSYRQLEISTGVHPQTDSRYASIGGSLSLDHLTTLAKFMQPSTQLVFGFDNDDKGARYALTALVALSKDSLALVQASQQGYIALQIPVAKIYNQFSKLIAEHSLAMQTYMPQVNGEVRDDMIKNMFHWVKGATVPTLEIPINTALLNSVNNLLIQYGQFSRSLAITRPRGKDFNEDLKAEQLRQIKRPILLINPGNGQVVDRFATEKEAFQFVEKDIIKAKKWKTIPIGTELQILKTEPSKLHPEILGQLLRTSRGIEKSFTDSFMTQVNRMLPDPTKSQEAML